MRALLVYEAQPALEVARAIADGLGERVQCTIATVEQVPPVAPGQYDVIVVGGPSNQAAVLIRVWTQRLGRTHALVTAAYDVRSPGARSRPGSTARVLSSALKKFGSASVARPHSFESDGEALLVGEAERAREWGVTLGVLAGVHPVAVLRD